MHPIARNFTKLLLGLVLLLLLQVPVAVAQSPDRCLISFERNFGTNALNRAIITCPFAGSESDRVTVYDLDGTMRKSDTWHDAVNFENEIWVFDAGGDGKANLIIHFHRVGDALVADLYDDHGVDDHVSHVIEDGEFRVTESEFWTVRVTAPDGWWRDGDTVNFNLDIEIDGPVIAAFAAELFYLAQLRNDGLVDYTMEVRDTDRDGRPNYQLVQAPRYGNHPLTHLMVNAADNEADIEGSIFWPFLGATGSGISKPYGKSIPPIHIDWQGSRITHVGEFVASRWNDSNWFIYSNSRFGPDGATYANFENPFAFYDLAQDADSYPELQIRSEYFGAYDGDYAFDAPYVPEERLLFWGRYPNAINNIRYSWDQDNNRSWDYKVDLIGSYQINETVEFPDFTVQTIPYDEFPYWVTERTWDVAAFVAVEDVVPAYWTSEGIYVWGPSWNLMHRYIPGVSSDLPEHDYTTIDEGMRGEYNVNYRDVPRIYFSPVDGKLHLYGAQEGLWNLGNNRVIAYHNLDDDPYIDQWSYLVSDYPRKTLYQTDDFIILAEGDTVRIRQGRTPRSTFTTLPPRSHADWQKLGDFLEAASGDIAPNDFQTMLAQFPGQTYHMTGAVLTDFRLTASGFDFVLNVLPEFKWQSNESLALVGKPNPGHYRVEYNGAWSATAIACPGLAVQSDGVVLVPDTVASLVPSKLQVDLATCGLVQDLNLNVLFSVVHDGVVETIAEEYLTTRGASVQTVSTQWAPPESGDWTVFVKVELVDVLGNLHDEVLIDRTVRVEPPVTADRNSSLLSLNGELPLNGIPLLVFLGGMIISAGVLTIILLTVYHFRPDPDVLGWEVEHAQDWQEARRLRAWELKKQGWKQKEIAATLGVSQSAVSQWLQKARHGGPEALRSRRKSAN